VKAVTATGDMALATAEGVAVTLAGVAPWLFAGTALSLAIAWARGLRECVSELREGLRPGRQPGSTAGPGAPAHTLIPPGTARLAPATAPAAATTDVASRSLTQSAQAAQDAPPSAS
jgi:hypothetical protein